MNNLLFVAQDLSVNYFWFQYIASEVLFAAILKFLEGMKKFIEVFLDTWC